MQLALPHVRAGLLLSSSVLIHGLALAAAAGRAQWEWYNLIVSVIATISLARIAAQGAQYSPPKPPSKPPAGGKGSKQRAVERGPFDGRVAVVTGCASGVGLHMSLSLLLPFSVVCPSQLTRQY